MQDSGAGPLLSHSAWSERFPCPGGLRFLLLLLEDLRPGGDSRVVGLCNPQDPHITLSFVPRVTMSFLGFQSSPAAVFRSWCWSPRVRIWLSVLDAVLLCPASVNASRDLGGSHRPPREKAMEGAEGPGGAAGTGTWTLADSCRTLAAADARLLVISLQADLCNSTLPYSLWNNWPIL